MTISPVSIRPRSTAIAAIVAVLVATIGFVSFAAPAADAQTTPVTDWFHLGGGPFSDEAHAVAVDSAGNSIVVYEVQPPGVFTSTSGNISLTGLTRQVVLAKYRPSGGLVWAKEIIGSRSQAFPDIAVDAIGNIYVTGRFEGTTVVGRGAGSQALTAVGSDDIFLAKFDPNGMTTWATSAGSAESEASQSVAVDAAGNVYIAGNDPGGVVFGSGTSSITTPPTGFTPEYGVGFIAKYTSAGAVEWVERTNVTGYTNVKAMTVDGPGNVYVTGYYSGATTLNDVPATGSIPEPNITFLQAIPNVSASLTFDGATAASGLGLGDDLDLTPRLGQSLQDVVVTLNGSAIPAVELGDVLLPDSGNTTIVLHLNSTGDPVVTQFSNDTTPITNGQGRVAFRHVAATGGVDITVDGTVAVRDLKSAREISADLSATNLSSEVLDGATQAVLVAAQDVPVLSGGSTVGYIVGGPGQGSTSLLIDTVSPAIAGGAPITLPSETGGGMFVAKYDTAGKAVWAVAGDGSDFDTGHDVAVDGQGNAYAVGLASSSVTFSDGGTTTRTRFTSQPRQEALLKISPSGSIVWATTIGLDGTSSPTFVVAADADGTVAVGGATRDRASFNSVSAAGFGATLNTNAAAGNTNAAAGFIAEWDTSGELQFAQLISGNAVEDVNGVAFDSAGGLFVIGETSFDEQGPFPVQGAQDGFIARYNRSASISTCAGPNDDISCADVIVASLPQAVTGSTAGLTAEAGEPAGCGSADRSAWWSWTAPSSGAVLVDTLGSSFDTQVAVYRGAASVSSLALVGCNDDVTTIGSPSTLVDESMVSFPAIAGTTYFIQVSGSSSTDSGNVSLRLAPTVRCGGKLPTMDMARLGVTSLSGTAGDDVVLGTADADTVVLYGGDDVACMGDGDDSANGREGNDTLFGGNGADLLYGRDGNDRLHGDTGNDTLYGGPGNDNMWGRDGDDEIYGDAGIDRIRGGDDNDQLYGGADRDIILGDDGWDRIFGEAGRDSLYGGEGNDTLDGGADTDLIRGQGGGDNLLSGPSGNDRMDGGDGPDWLDAAMTTGSTRMLGGAGDDRFRGSNQLDRMWGGDGDDIMYGRGYNDLMRGGAGDDMLYGETGRDTLDGGAGNDLLDGGSGSGDKMVGMSGTDSCNGGPGVADFAHSTCESVVGVP